MPRILVADDNTNIQKMVALAFEERGIDVVSVGNGEAAVRRIPDMSPDLVLADVFMPVRNGYEVCEFVKTDERFSHIPVILLVGAFDPLDEKEARRVGADGVLKKPFVPPDPLIAMVTSALEKNPKLAAELAKAKETVVDVPPPPPALEIPAKAETKPLPEFPEPSPEEAAVIYGFGKGVRNLDAKEIQSDESKTPQTPVTEGRDEEEEEFEGASTTRDWRRTAALNLDVPDEPGGKLAFASDGDFNPISFPSEQEVPPKRVHLPEHAQELDPPASSVAPPEVHVEVTAPAIECAPEPAPVLNEPLAQEPRQTVVEERTTQSWMDMMTPSPSEYHDGGWLTEIPGTVSEGVAAENSTETPAPAVQAEAPLEVASPAPAEHSEPEEPFFADESETADQWFAHPATTQEAVPKPAQTVAPEPVAELISEPSDEQVVSLRDPELEEPVAAHVIPEPLLENDEPPKTSAYGSQIEEPAPLHSFFSPASGDPVLEETPIEEAPAPASPAAADVAWPETKSAEIDNRIPTMPPPNREALADIPFLNPQPLAATEAFSTSNTDPGTVNAVVEKLLEKLEPQLHEMLSQGLLRPLVENLLQQELAKKEK